jgi:hypothetical protein
VYLDIRKCGNDLVLRWKLGTLLEFEVANRAGQSKIAIDATEVNKASCGLNACFLGCTMLASA